MKDKKNTILTLILFIIIIILVIIIAILNLMHKRDIKIIEDKYKNEIKNLEESNSNSIVEEDEQSKIEEKQNDNEEKKEEIEYDYSEIIDRLNNVELDESCQIAEENMEGIIKTIYYPSETENQVKIKIYEPTRIKDFFKNVSENKIMNYCNSYLENIETDSEYNDAENLKLLDTEESKEEDKNYYCINFEKKLINDEKNNIANIVVVYCEENLYLMELLGDEELIKENKDNLAEILNLHFNEIFEYEYPREILSYDEILEKADEKGYDVVGKIRIPDIEIEYPIFSEVAKGTLELGTAILYGPGLNQIGNTIIMGHNYRDGSFFSDLDELEDGDLIYITDLDNNEIEYEIYDKYETTVDDAEYMLRDTENKREISLSTSTDDASNRIIIYAREIE